MKVKAKKRKTGLQVSLYKEFYKVLIFYFENIGDYHYPKNEIFH